jgi:hypothetical protein
MPAGIFIELRLLLIYLVRMTISGFSSKKTDGLLGLGALDWSLAGKTRQVS